MELIRDIRLWGVLGDKFGHHHRLVVRTPAEALAAIEANRPGFLAYIGRLHDEGFGFACFIGDKNIKAEQLEVPLGADSFEIAPIIRGAGGGNGVGVIEIIIGVVLIVAAVVLGPIGWASAGAWYAMSAGTAVVVGLAGASLVLGGVSMLLTPKPKLDVRQDESSKTRQSDFFGGAVNTTAQGQPVPVLMGELFCGSATISLGVQNEDRTLVEISEGI